MAFNIFDVTLCISKNVHYSSVEVSKIRGADLHLSELDRLLDGFFWNHKIFMQANFAVLFSHAILILILLQMLSVYEDM